MAAGGLGGFDRGGVAAGLFGRLGAFDHDLVEQARLFPRIRRPLGFGRLFVAAAGIDRRGVSQRRACFGGVVGDWIVGIGRNHASHRDSRSCVASGGFFADPGRRRVNHNPLWFFGVFSGSSSLHFPYLHGAVAGRAFRPITGASAGRCHRHQRVQPANDGGPGT